MNNALVLFAIALLVNGCSPQQTSDSPSVTIAVETNGKWITALGNIKLGPKYMSPPDADDMAYAKQLPQEVAWKCIGFLDRGGSIKPTPLYARRVGSYILVALAYKDGPSDSDHCVVYSAKDERVLGRFVWYTQP